MPSNHTVNFDLSQWERTDKVLMDDFNADNKKLDDALKAQADALAAEKSAREAALSAEAKAREAINASLGAAMAGLGNCQVEHLTVDLGPVNGDPPTIRFSAEPELFVVMGGHFMYGSRHMTYLTRFATSTAPTLDFIKVTWNGSDCKLATALNGSHHVLAFSRKDL